MGNDTSGGTGIVVRCTECGYTGDVDTFDVLGADEDCLFCNQCDFHGRMEDVEES